MQSSDRDDAGQDLAAGVSRMVESRLENFDKSWYQGGVPNIADFLPPEEGEANSQARHKLLVELVMVDQEYRWRRSSQTSSQTSVTGSTAEDPELPPRPWLVDYVRRYSDLGALEYLPAQLLSNEFRILQRWGDRPTVSAYLSRYRHHVEIPSQELARIESATHETTGRSALRLSCPQCHEIMELEHRDLSEVVCPACSGHFSLVDETKDPPKQLGRFELQERIGAGSFGAVWRAHDADLNRAVAVKVPRRGQLTSDEAERFLCEARAAAKLRHPNIVSVHEVGRDGDTVYIVSDYVAGVTLADWLLENQPSHRESVVLCSKIAEALHHAHGMGVVHRDLKPGNIMLADSSEPHIMDFGLARQDTAEVTVTIDGRVLGTPAYMPPEQAKGEGHQADGRADVYSLGVILFELLTGERPFRGDVGMMLQRVIHDDPPSPRKLNSSVSQDLETICLKCLEKDPRRRYTTAADLAQELKRVLLRQPIHARPISSMARGVRWCKRNPIIAALAAALVVSITGGMVGVAHQWLRADREAKSAIREAADATTARGIALVAQQRAEEEAELRRRQLYLSDIVAAQQAWTANNVGKLVELLDRHIPDSAQQDLRGFEWYYLRRLGYRSESAVSFQFGGPAFSVDFSPDATTLAVGGIGTVRLWDVETKAPLAALEGHQHIVPGLAYAPDGRTLATGGWDRTLRLWDLEAGTASVLSAPGPIFRIAYSPEGDLLATPGAGSSVMLWDTLNGQLLQQLEGHAAGVRAVGFSPDGQLLASGGLDGEVIVWRVAEREKIHVLKGHTDWVESVTFSPNQAALASAGRDNVVRLWDLETAEQIRVLVGHKSNVMSVRFSPDGKSLASAGWDGTAKVWSVQTGSETDTLKGHSGGVQDVAFSPDGDRLCSVGGDGLVKLWDMTQAKPIDVVEGVGVAVSPVDSVFATWKRDGTVLLWDARTGELKQTLSRNGVGAVSFSADGRQLAWGTRDRGIELLDLKTRDRRELPKKHRGSVAFVSFSPVASPAVSPVIASASWDGLRLWDIGKDELIARIPIRKAAHNQFAYPVAISPDGETVATFHGRALDLALSLYDKTGNELAVLEKPKLPMTSLSFSPDGRILAAGSWSGQVKLWDTAEAKLLTILKGHGQQVYGVAFSPNGDRMASSGADGTIKLWNPLTGEEVLTLEHGGLVYSVAFSSDGQALISASNDEIVKLWRRSTD